MNYRKEEEIKEIMMEIKNKGIKLENKSLRKRTETEVLTKNKEIKAIASKGKVRLYFEGNYSNSITCEHKNQKEQKIWFKSRQLSKSEKILEKQIKDVMETLLQKNFITGGIKALQTEEEENLEKRVKEKTLKMAEKLKVGQKEKRKKEEIEITLFKKSETEFEFNLKKAEELLFGIEKDKKTVTIKTEKEEYTLIEKGALITYDPDAFAFYEQLVKRMCAKKEVEEMEDLVNEYAEVLNLVKEKKEELEYQEYFDKKEDYQEKIKKEQEENITKEEVLVGVPITKEEVLGDDILILLEKMEIHTFQNKELNEKIKDLNKIYLEALGNEDKLMLLSKHYLKKNVPEDFKAFFQIMFDLPSKTYFEEKAFVFVENLTGKINEINKMIQKQLEDQLEIMLKVSEKRNPVHQKKELNEAK